MDGLSLGGEPDEKGRSVVRAREFRDLIANSLGIPPIRRIAEHLERDLADRVRRAPLRCDRSPRAESATAICIHRLVGVNRDREDRQAVAERGGDGAEPGVRDREVAVREENVLGDIALDVDVPRPWAEVGGVSIAADREDELDRLTLEAFEDRLEEAWCAAVDDGAEGGVDDGLVGEARNPLRERLVALAAERDGAQEMSRPRRRAVGITEAGRLAGEVQVAEEHLSVRVGRQSLQRSQPRHLLRDQLPSGIGREQRVAPDGSVRDAQRLAGDAGAELGHLAHEHIRPPASGDLQQVGRHSLRVQRTKQPMNPEQRPRRSVAGERLELRLQPPVALVRALALPVEARGERREPARLDPRMERRRSREANLVPRCLQLQGDWHERMEVPKPGQRREQEAHASVLPQPR